MMDIVSKEQIIEAEYRLLNSIKKSDVESLDDLIHTDLLFHLPNGQIITKEMDLEAYRSGNMHVHSIAASEQSINIIGDSAVVSVLIELNGEAFGQPIEGNFRYLRVWKLIDRKLKIIAGSCIKL